MKFEILQQKTLENIPSASGLVKAGLVFYVVGDDSPFLFKLNQDFQEVARINLLAGEHRERIPKPEKPDFEALEMISQKEFLCFGSGSLSPQRDVMLRILPEEKPAVEQFSLSSFYAKLKTLPLMQDSELNIEAAAIYREELLLFNRRKNVIFSFNFPEFFRAIQGKSPFPEIKATAFELPKLNGIEAGFSGATFTASGKLLVTAAVEATDNAYDDGEVLGSFIGISSGVKKGNFDEFLWTIIPSKTALKIESICVVEEISEKEISVALVSDSDGAESLLLQGILNF